MSEPRQITYFECPYCGKAFTVEGEAKTCMENHLHPDELKIDNVATVNAEDNVYREGDPFPTILKVKSKHSDATEFYKLIDMTSGAATMPLGKDEIKLSRRGEA